jgi:hypothetical protein
MPSIGVFSPLQLDPLQQASSPHARKLQCNRARSFLYFVQTIYLEPGLSVVWLRGHRKKGPSKAQWRLHYSACFYWQLLVFMV